MNPFSIVLVAGAALAAFMLTYAVKRARFKGVVATCPGRDWKHRVLCDANRVPLRFKSDYAAGEVLSDYGNLRFDPPSQFRCEGGRGPTKFYSKPKEIALALAAIKPDHFLVLREGMTIPPEYLL
ncbi:hypothetical protein HOI83_00960 [Candidatus Uhrbacteria bacterium]|jgi:hypothetical protein|nr:hypothetical protein [Candidatus Uhrbacteria bacterium]